MNHSYFQWYTVEKNWGRKMRTKQIIVSSAKSLIELSFSSMYTADWQLFLSVLSFSLCGYLSTSSNKGLFLNLGGNLWTNWTESLWVAAFLVCILTVLTNMSQLLLLFCIASTSFAQELTATKQGNLYSLFHDLFSVDPDYLLLLYPADTKLSSLSLQSGTNAHVLSIGVCIPNGEQVLFEI